MDRITIMARLGAVLMLGMPMTALAMPNTHDGPCDMHRMPGQQRMADQLGLTNEQRQQFKHIHRNSRSKLMGLRDAEQDNVEALHQLNPDDSDFNKETARLAHALGKIMEQKIIQHSRIRAQVYALLTPEQRKKAESLLKQHITKRGRPELCMIGSRINQFSEQGCVRT